MGARSLWRTRAILASKRSMGALVLLLVCFLGIGLLVRYSFLQPIDIHVTKELQETSGLPLDQIMLLATALGSTLVVLVLAAIAVAGLVWKQHPRAAWYVALSLLSIPVDVLLKLIWARARPDENLVHVMVNRVGFSFPSGHALIGTSFYGALAILAWIHFKEHRIRKPAVIVLATLPAVIDISRVYLGAHWFSDVLGGTTVGLILLVVLTSWYRHDKAEVAAPINLEKAKPT